MRDSEARCSVSARLVLIEVDVTGNSFFRLINDLCSVLLTTEPKFAGEISL